MTRSQRCLSFLIALTMVFSLFGFVYAGGEGSTREGYHNGLGTGTSYYWIYDVDNCELYISFESCPDNVLIQDYENETVVDICDEAQFITVNSDKDSSVLNLPEFKSLKAIELTGSGTYSGVIINNLKPSTPVNLSAKVVTIINPVAMSRLKMEMPWRSIIRSMLILSADTYGTVKEQVKQRSHPVLRPYLFLHLA